MAHKFTVLDTSGAVITYDDYDKIPKDTIMALISFLPDISPSGTRGDGEELGHEIDPFQILLESDTFDAGDTEKFRTDEIFTDNNLIAETGVQLVQESGNAAVDVDNINTEAGLGDKILISPVGLIQPVDETSDVIASGVHADYIVLDGSDAEGSNAGGALIAERTAGRHRLAMEDRTKQLILQDAPDSHREPHFRTEADAIKNLSLIHI